MQNSNNKKEEEEDVTTVKREDYQYTPKEGFVLTHFLTVADVKRSTDFYLRILGGKVIRSGEPTIIQIANSSTHISTKPPLLFVHFPFVASVVTIVCLSQLVSISRSLNFVQK